MDRLEFHQKLCDILGSNHVYFQPPSSMKIEYPAIIYKLDNVRTRKADNDLYLSHKCITVTVVHKDPDNDVYMRLLKLPMSSFDTSYQKDNLNHYVLSIYI